MFVAGGNHSTALPHRPHEPSTLFRLMSYYMRYLLADDRPVSVADVETFFATLDGEYATEGGEDEVVVNHTGDAIAYITFNAPGDGLFEEELEELREFADDAEDGPGKRQVLATLEGARQIVAAQILMGGRDPEAVLSALDPFWAWLFAERKGLMQADGEGYYNAEGQILEVE